MDHCRVEAGQVFVRQGDQTSGTGGELSWVQEGDDDDEEEEDEKKEEEGGGGGGGRGVEDDDYNDEDDKGE